MEREKTEELLRKYYEGLTSAEEEEQLRNLPGIPAADGEFAADRILLSAGGTGVPEPSDDFIRDLEAVTRQDEKRDEQQDEQRSVPGRLYRYVMSLAAAIALLIGSYFIFRTVPGSEPADTFSDPELAMAEVRNILLNVSQNMNAGTGALRTINTFDRSLSRLRNLNELNPGGEENDRNNE